MNTKANFNIIKRKHVEARTGLSRATIYAKLRRNPKRPHEYDPTFPKPVQITKGAIGWIESEVEAWIASRMAARNNSATKGGER